MVINKSCCLPSSSHEESMVSYPLPRCTKHPSLFFPSQHLSHTHTPAPWEPWTWQTSMMMMMMMWGHVCTVSTENSHELHRKISTHVLHECMWFIFILFYSIFITMCFFVHMIHYFHFHIKGMFFSLCKHYFLFHQ